MIESANFGKVIGSYRGSGELYIDDSERRSCEFEIVQNTVGTLYTMCELQVAPDDVDIYGVASALQLVGVDEEKKKITVNRLILKEMHQGIVTDEVQLQFVFIGGELIIEADQYPKSDDLEYRFALVNFAFFGTEPYVEERQGTRFMRRQLPLKLGPSRIIIRPLRDYGARENESRATKRPDVTCQAIVENVAVDQEQDVIDAVDDLCLLLTLARGCRIEWPYYDVLSPSGETVKSYHRDAIIKPYSGLSLIAESPAEDTKSFIESTYPKFREMEELWELRKAVDTYTDAKLETDFIESRGLKAAIVMEHLKSRYLEHLCRPPKLFIIDSRLFEQEKDRLLKETKKVVQEVFPNLQSEQTQMMANHAQAFNWYTFRRSVSDLCIALGLKINSEERGRFVNIRNELVHRLSYLDNPDRNRSEWEQYKFLITFVGKILLAILEYDGYYLDWTKPIDFEDSMRVKLDLELNDQQ